MISCTLQIRFLPSSNLLAALRWAFSLSLVMARVNMLLTLSNKLEKSLLCFKLSGRHELVIWFNISCNASSQRLWSLSIFGVLKSLWANRRPVHSSSWSPKDSKSLLNNKCPRHIVRRELPPNRHLLRVVGFTEKMQPVPSLPPHTCVV
uniref:ORF74 n=1 Tax=Malaco herpesvirus 4 TaxID=3031800 RepID=A0AA48SF23_9VIRU|nr:TPA_asm: ORF74 [Malaco herpesvirus 4]